MDNFRLEKAGRGPALWRRTSLEWLGPTGFSPPIVWAGLPSSKATGQKNCFSSVHFAADKRTAEGCAKAKQKQRQHFGWLLSFYALLDFFVSPVVCLPRVCGPRYRDSDGTPMLLRAFGRTLVKKIDRATATLCFEYSIFVCWSKCERVNYPQTHRLLAFYEFHHWPANLVKM